MWLDPAAALMVFGGRWCTFEAPAWGGLKCGLCRGYMATVRFVEHGPLLTCGAHGVWLDAEDRVLLPTRVRYQLQVREKAAAFFDWLLAPYSNECVEIYVDGGSGEVGGGGDGGCGGGCD